MAASEFFSFADSDLVPGIRFDRTKYDIVHAAILENLRRHGTMTFTRLSDLVEAQLRHTFDGPIMVYYTNVRLDMEACGEIYRIPKSSPPLIALYQPIA